MKSLWIRRRWNLAWLAADYFVSALIWGEPDITISSKTAEARNQGRAWGHCGCVLLNWMFRVADHCSGALLHDRQRAAMTITLLLENK